MKLQLCIVLVSVIHSAVPEVPDSGGLFSSNPKPVNGLVDDALGQFATEPFTFPSFRNDGLEISNGKVHGLSRIRRTGDCLIRSSGNDLKADCDIGVDSIRLKVCFNWEGSTGNLEAKMPSINAKIIIIATKTDIKLESFSVTHLSRMEVTSLNVDGFFGAFVSRNAVDLNEHRDDIIRVIETEGSKRIRDILPSLANKLVPSPSSKHDEF